MSVSGRINAFFMYYTLYGEVRDANPKIIVYKKSTGTGTLVKYKELAATCSTLDVYNGVGLECTASDTSQDEYTADAFAIGRSQFAVEGVTSEVVMIYYTTVSKTRDQKLEVKLRVELTSGQAISPPSLGTISL